MEVDERSYLWQHFAFNADQRLKAFNFFVVFSVFADGGVFAALEKNSHGLIFILIGGFVCILSFVFWIIDTRSRSLIQLAIPGLIACEKRLTLSSRIFTRESEEKNLPLGYTTAFRILFTLQFLFGLGVVIFGIDKWFF